MPKTLRRLADEGPEYFTHGDWARHFVALANELGWKIKLEDMSSNPPRWDEPITYRHKGYEIAQPTPPQRQAVYCALVLGILRPPGRQLAGTLHRVRGQSVLHGAGAAACGLRMRTS